LDLDPECQITEDKTNQYDGHQPHGEFGSLQGNCNALVGGREVRNNYSDEQESGVSTDVHQTHPISSPQEASAVSGIPASGENNERTRKPSRVDAAIHAEACGWVPDISQTPSRISPTTKGRRNKGVRPRARRALPTELDCVGLSDFDNPAVEKMIPRACRPTAAVVAESVQINIARSRSTLAL